MDLKNYIGSNFTFAEVFTCYIEEDGVWIEQYGEGRFKLEHIKTEEQLITLYQILTGKTIYEWT